MQNVYIRKAKILKSPKLDLGKLLESHGEIETVRIGMISGEDCTEFPLFQAAGTKVVSDFVEPEVQASV